MLAGAVFGYRGLVREILRRIVSERFSGKQVHVVATGGYARLIVRGMAEVTTVRENLTLEGLRLVGCLNNVP
jgi:type III pantothenate kinase